MEYDNNLTGAVFPVKEKKSERHPDASGTSTLNNKEYWTSSWKKESKAGKTYVSLSLQEKDGSKEYRGVLFRNDKKTEDKHADWTGHLEEGDDKPYTIQAWDLKSKDGNPYRKLEFKSTATEDTVQEAPQLYEDEEIPF